MVNKMLEIYVAHGKMTIVEPSGKVHTSKLNTKEYENYLDLTVLNKYLDKDINIIHPDGTKIKRKLSRVGIDNDGVHFFVVSPW